MMHRVVAVDQGSIAEEIGVAPGFLLAAVDNEEIHDVIDYELLTAKERLELRFVTDDQGGTLIADVEKELYEPLGLRFESGLMSPVRNCRNRCVFCFIDQMPRGVRESLHEKDDDWRLSLIMGNYITLTNIDEAEFNRIIARHVSPLYISVHATDGQIRARMMNNPAAATILERLRRLYDAKIHFNAQVVVCPGINDGEVLDATLEDLYKFHPYAESVAIVPVGLTKYRDGLEPLRGMDACEARAIIKQVELVNNRCRSKHHEGFAYASDELYLLAGLDLPDYDAYDGFPQIENGVGLLRKFEREFMDALEGRQPIGRSVRIDAASGEAAYGFLAKLMGRLAGFGLHVTLHPVTNRYFGGNVNVSGLVTAGDLIDDLYGKLEGEFLIIPDSMLRAGDTVFLDGMELGELERALGRGVFPLCAGDGEGFIEGLFERVREWPLIGAR